MAMFGLIPTFGEILALMYLPPLAYILLYIGSRVVFRAYFRTREEFRLSRHHKGEL